MTARCPTCGAPRASTWANRTRECLDGHTWTVEADVPDCPDGCDWGETPQGAVVHAVDFDADNVLCDGDTPDRTLCGRRCDAARVDRPEAGSQVCTQCRQVIAGGRREGVPT